MTLKLRSFSESPKEAVTDFSTIRNNSLKMDLILVARLCFLTWKLLFLTQIKILKNNI